MDASPSPDGDPITALWLQLLGAGYEPIPVVGPDAPGNSPGKRPALREWQSVRLDLDMVRDWRSGSLRGCTNTGLRTGQLVGIDIDVLLPSLARDLQELAVRLFGGTPLRRIGQAPKLLLCYRAVEETAKATTPEFRLPDGSKAQVEILAKGQQFVAYGVHPVTRTDYEWPEAGPDIVPLAQLPVITLSDVRAFLAAAEVQIRTAGGVHAKEAAVEQHALPEQVNQPPSEPAGKVRSGGDFFRNVNAAALSDIRCWFLRLFPKGYWQENASRPPGAWRVHSADIGRALEEDISVHETEGGHDFGTRQSRTPIDLVMEHGGAPAPKDAAFLLCEWLHTTPQSLGWQQEPGAEISRGAGVQKPSSSPHAEPWPEPVDFPADNDLTGVPELLPQHLPEALYRFVVDTAERMGVDPISVALSAVVACSSVTQDGWSIQPKVHDHTWTENPRLWGAIVGDPSILKTPVIRACTRPIDALDARARDEHAAATRAHKAAVDAWKAQGSDPSTEPRMPRLTRYMVEGTTTEALSEVLRDDPEAKQRAAAGKVLVRQDEMGEFFANLDRYRSGGKGGGDRGAYLRLYNGGRFVLDRVGRGSFACSNWSACFLGGIQPGPIQCIAREADDDGLLQRFLYCVPGQQTAGEDRVPDAAALARYEALFPALVALHPAAASFGQTARAVVLHGGAHSHREALTRMCRALAAMPDTSARLKAALGKWPGLFARLTLLFHLIEAADAHARGLEPPLLTVVSERVARRAAGFLRDVLLPHLLRADALIFSTAQTGHARWIAGFILAQGGERVTQRDVVQAYGALRAPESRRELRDVMESLVTVGWLQPEPQANPSRPPTAWAVNPVVHTLYAEQAGRERESRRQTQQHTGDLIRRHRRERR